MLREGSTQITVWSGGGKLGLERKNRECTFLKLRTNPTAAKETHSVAVVCPPFAPRSQCRQCVMNDIVSLCFAVAVLSTSLPLSPLQGGAVF